MTQNYVKAVIVGAAGRMGQRLLHALHETPNILLVGAVERPDHPSLGRDAGENRWPGKVEHPADRVPPRVIVAGDVIIDFTNAKRP